MRRQHKCGVVRTACIVLGVLLLLLAVQQKFFCFWDEWRVHVSGQTVIAIPASDLWWLSCISAFTCFLCAWCAVWTRPPIAMSVCVLVALWGLFALLTYACEQARPRAPHPVYGAGHHVVAPGRDWWQEHEMARRARLDPTYSISIGLALSQIVLAVLLACCLPTGSRLHGFCSSCGYNLRGNTSGRCPECGTACGSGKGVGSEWHCRSF